MSSFHRILAGAVALVILSLGAQAARAGNDSSYTRKLQQNLPVAADTRVTVENMAGAVEVVQGGVTLEVHASVVAGGESTAAARTLADSIRLDVKRDGKQVTVHVHYPVDRYSSYQYIPTKPSNRHHGLHFLGFNIGHSSSSFSYQGTRVHVYEGKDEGVPLHVDLEIRVPAGLHAHIDNRMGPMHADQVHGELSMRNGSGDIAARGITGSLTTRSGSGDIDVADITGPLDVQTGSGDVKLNGVHGDASVSTGSGDIQGGNIRGDSQKLQTGSGDIKLDGLGGDLKVQTGSGDIGLRGLTAVKQARIGSGSGDINLDGDLSALEQFEINSGSGDISLASAKPPSVHLEIHGSDIGVHWPNLRNVEKGRRHFNADIGRASGSGRINTGSGDIVLRP